MNSPTTRHASPAAAPRTGQGSGALLRQDSGAKTQSLPFAALPHDLRKDPRLKANRTAIVLAAALLEYAPGSKPSCYPTNTRLAADLGCCEQTVRTALAALQSAGWIKIVRGSNQPNGRRIWLTWRMDRCTVPALRQVLDTPQSVGPLPQPVGPPLKPTGPEEEIVIEKGIEEESRQFARAIERPRGEPEPAPTATPAQLPAPEPTAEPTLAPSALAVQVPPPAPEVGPRAARPAIPVTPAGPTPQSAPGPVPSGVMAPAEVDPRQNSASPPFRLARTRSSQSEPPSALGPPAFVAAPEPCPGLARGPRVELSRSAPVPTTPPAKVGPGATLTPEQQQRLAALPEAVREQVYLWLMSGDMILMREAQRRLTPPRPRPETPRTLPELLSHIRDDPSFPALAADWLAKTFGDHKSYSGFKARCEEAWRGELSVSQLVSAYEQATGPRAKNRGAIFMYAVRQNE